MQLRQGANGAKAVRAIGAAKAPMDGDDDPGTTSCGQHVGELCHRVRPASTVEEQERPPFALFADGDVDRAVPLRSKLWVEGVIWVPSFVRAHSHYHMLL